MTRTTTVRNGGADREVHDAGFLRAGSSTTILIVDAQEASRRAMKAVVENAGFGVAEAVDAADAQRKLSLLRPAVAIVEAALPGTGGIELCGIVKRDFPETMVLQTAGPYADAAMRARILERADGFLVRPAQPEEIVAALNALLRLRLAEATLRRTERHGAMGQFAGDFVHDFNNLITAVTGSLELILARPDDARRARWAANALEAAERAARLTSHRLASVRSGAEGRAAPIIPTARHGSSVLPLPQEASLHFPMAQGRGCHILVVDDENHVRTYVTELLVGLGYETEQADGGTTALAAMEARLPDLFIVDFAMPGMTGAEFALRVLCRAPDARILFMTGHADSAALGAIGPDIPILRKPFRSEDLAAAVRDALAS
jgi:CheY-like chemotaxis protein